MFPNSVVLGRYGYILNALPNACGSFVAFIQSIVHHIVWSSLVLFVSFFSLRQSPRHSLGMHRRHTQDLAPLAPPQLGSHHAVDSRSDGVAGLADQHAGVVVELDHGSVGSLHLLPRPHDDGVSDVAALHLVGC